MKEAFACYTKAVRRKPDSSLFLRLWANCLTPGNLPKLVLSHDEEICLILSRWLRRPEAFASGYARAAYFLIKLNPLFGCVMKEASKATGDKTPDYLWAAEKLSSIPLLIQIMSLSHAIDPELEEMFTRLRRAMLDTAATIPADRPPELFSVALAMLCFNNDYVFDESESEKTAVEVLSGHLQAQVVAMRPFSWHQLVALAAYRPLHSFVWSKNLVKYSAASGMDDLIRQQVLEPEEELQLTSAISSFGKIDNDVSCHVRNMYEASPYPRWVKPTICLPEASCSATVRQFALDPLLNDRPVNEETRVLVAGCGTGQHAITVATRYPPAQVTAVDLSLPSLAHALRKTREAGISNIRYLHGDILDLKSLDEQFDIIECIGVLHHMDDPVRGWHVLKDILKPGGIMRIGLYSEQARKAIVKIHEQNKAFGIAAGPDNIRAIRRQIMRKAASGDMDMQSLLVLRDFFSLKECMDMLFHVREHRFSLLQIEKLLEVLGLTFLGLQLPDEEFRKVFMDEFGKNIADLKNLDLWDKFERRYPFSFIGMYVFWVKKPAI